MATVEEPDPRTLPAVYGQFGQALAFAERTLTAILREHLAERDTTPEVWYAPADRDARTAVSQNGAERDPRRLTEP